MTTADVRKHTQDPVYTIQQLAKPVSSSKRGLTVWNEQQSQTRTCQWAAVNGSSGDDLSR